MSQSLPKTRGITSLAKKKKDINIDDSPTLTTQNSPRNASNASFYGAANGYGNSSGNVKVVCRVRPFNQREVDLGGIACLDVEDDKTVAVKTNQYMDGGPGLLSFTLDRVFNVDSTQEEVYEFSARPVIESVLEGFNGTVLAYGQTSSGKTYTMMGPELENPEFCGVIPRMVTTVFDYISDTPDHIEFTVKVSIVEIYMERIRDLLNPKKVNLKVREDKSKGIYIEDVTESYVSDEKDVYDFLKYGHNNRATTTTNMNESSSRSHSIFMMTIHQNNLLEMSAKTGKLYLVDLAGSEKVAKTGAVGQVLEEAKEINKSLSALGNVINALTDNRGHQHIPYRDSKLTRILQESLGGNSRTSLIINCSPSSFNENETLSALRFGYRAKSIKNTPKINREFTAAQLQVLLEKSEKKVTIKDRRIRQLEAILNDHGIELPDENDDGHSPFGKRQNRSHLGKFNEEVEETMEFSDREDESCSKVNLMSPSRIAKGDQQERVKALEDELRIERLTLGKQTEKVKILKKDLTEANTKMVMVEKENEALINKLATLTLKMQELEEKFRDKEMKLEILQLLKDILMTENEELKKSRKYLLHDLMEENNEIVSLAQAQGLLTPKKKTDLREKDTPISAWSEDSEKKRDNFLFLLDSLIKDLIKEIIQKLNIKNVQLLKELTFPYVEKLKEAFCLQSEYTDRKSGSPMEEDPEMRRRCEALKEELNLEKQRTTQVKKDYEKAIKEYNNIAKNNIPSFEEWKKGIVNDPEENGDSKDDTLIFKDYPNRYSKESKLITSVDYAKEKSKNLKAGDNNPDTSLQIDRIISTPTNASNATPKSPMKTQRMLNLEKQLHETKELVNQYKNKIESLKSLITSTPNGSQQGYATKFESVDTFEQHKQIIKQEVLNQVNAKDRRSSRDQDSLSPRSSANVKIVKPIKGGSNKEKDKKSSIASQKFFDILKQQYRLNRSFINGIGEGILNKQKQTGSGNKSSNDLKSKGA